MRRRSLLQCIGTGTGTGLLGALAGCTEEGDGTTPTETADVAVRSVGSFGDILVDRGGRTLYLFTNDSGDESSCYDQCAETWPPLTVQASPAAGDGVTAPLGTTDRGDGSRQVTAAGNPLYYFANDSQPGDTKGQGVIDSWYVVAPDGQAVKSASEGGGGGSY